MRIRALLLMLLAAPLVACVPPTPYPKQHLLPPEVVYQQTAPEFFLKHQLAVGDFSYLAENKEEGSILFANFSAALEEALAKGEYLAPKGKKARYVLSGEVRDVRVPRCIFGSCESGSAVQYELTDAATKRVVYSQLLVVPYTTEAPIFMDSVTAVEVVTRAYQRTVGENIAQAIQVLNRLYSSDLK